MAKQAKCVHRNDLPSAAYAARILADSPVLIIDCEGRNIGTQRCTIAPVHWHRKSRTIIRVRRPRQSECNVMMTGIVDLQLAEIRARTTGEERRGLSTQMTLYKGRLFRVTANPPLQGKAVRAPVALQTFSIGSTFYLLLHQPKSSPCCRFFHMDEPTSST